MPNHRLYHIALFCLLIGLSACTTYVEDRASADFEPVFPTVELTTNDLRQNWRDLSERTTRTIFV